MAWNGRWGSLSYQRSKTNDWVCGENLSNIALWFIRDFEKKTIKTSEILIFRCFRCFLYGKKSFCRAKYIGKLASCEIRCILGYQVSALHGQIHRKACILWIPMLSWHSGRLVVCQIHRKACILWIPMFFWYAGSAISPAGSAARLFCDGPHSGWKACGAFDAWIGDDDHGVGRNAGPIDTFLKQMWQVFIIELGFCI